MKETIHLDSQQWSYDTKRRLGSPGGFGDVYEGAGPDGTTVAVKKLRMDAEHAAHRELQMAELLGSRPFEHVVPVLDSGQDASSGGYFVVMPKATRSLEQELEASTFSIDDAVDVLRSIALGLQEVSEVTHRDLKPGNVLLLDGVWRVSDFGIARFVEEATADSTLKGFLTPAYAAPEQWRGDRASTATDLYALGCIAYALVSGSPPFIGPSPEEFQTQHLEQSPPPLDVDSPQLRSLVSMMLRKNPPARPSLPRVLQLLSQIAQSVSVGTELEGVSSLREIGADIAAREAEAEATREAERRAWQTRVSLADEATKLLVELLSELFGRIATEAPTASIRPNQTITLGGGSLSWSLEHSVLPADSFHVQVGT